jgi:hypothetical protein
MERERSLPAFSIGTTIASPHLDGKEPSVQIPLYMLRRNNNADGGKYHQFGIK